MGFRRVRDAEAVQIFEKIVGSGGQRYRLSSLGHVAWFHSSVCATLDRASNANKVRKRHVRPLPHLQIRFSSRQTFSSQPRNFPVAFENGLSDTPPRRSDAAHGPA